MPDSGSSVDKVYAQSRAQIGDFVFDEAVARVFADMIQRSVPGYEGIIRVMGLIAGQYGQDHTHLYDLGCSLGAGTLAMRQGLTAPGCQLIAIDHSKAMIVRCRQYIEADPSITPVAVIEADLLDYPMRNASVVALNFTLQFIAPDQRSVLLRRIYDAMVPGGCLVLSEKLAFDTKSQRVLDDLYWGFKRSNGYSDLEISQKRTALEQVMIPETLQAQQDRLHQVGFNQVIPWYQCLNFCSLLAIKSS